MMKKAMKKDYRLTVCLICGLAAALCCDGVLVHSAFTRATTERPQARMLLHLMELQRSSSINGDQKAELKVNVLSLLSVNVTGVLFNLQSFCNNELHSWTGSSTSRHYNRRGTQEPVSSEKAGCYLPQWLSDADSINFCILATITSFVLSLQFLVLAYLP